MTPHRSTKYAPRTFRFSDAEMKEIEELAEIANTNRSRLVQAMVKDYLRIIKTGRDLKRDREAIKQGLQELLDKTEVTTDAY